MNAPGRVLIVGQGLAGTALGLELEAAGIDFSILHGGDADAASLVAAGLVNPVTGQRWVKGWGMDTLLPEAAAFYRRAGRTFGGKIWHPVRLTRLWRDADERGLVEKKIRRGELAPHVAACSAEGVEISGAAWVDLPALLRGARERWRNSGCWQEARPGAEEFGFEPAAVSWRGERFAAVILCTGAGALARGLFGALPFVVAKGETITVSGAAIARGEVLNRGVWVMGEAGGSARIGATYERGVEDAAITDTARTSLLAAACEFVGGELHVTDQAAGVRLGLADRLPVAGWHPQLARVGLLGGFGSKGALWAPWLARCWRGMLDGSGDAFPSDISSVRV